MKGWRGVGKKQKEEIDLYLPDTNIFILGFQEKTPESKFLTKAISKGQLYISAVVVGEFLAKANESERKGFLQLMNVFEILPVDKEVAQVAAEYRKQMIVKTKRVVLIDCFLAAQAKVYGLVFVTNNVSDFPMKDIKIIKP
jgi:predicted nucleic acid-binding protein